MTMTAIPVFCRRFSLSGLLLACLALGCGQAAPPEEEKTPPAPVKWMEARQLFISEWTEIIGTTQPLPDRSAHVTAAVEGHVVSVLQDAAGKPISEGQRVKKGDVLIRLYDQIARNARDKAAADLEVLRQQVDQAKSSVKLAEIEVRRLKELMKRDLASPIDLEKAEIGVEEARSKQQGAELSAKAGEAQLKSLDEQLHLYTLTAPISGRLGRIFVVPGQTLAIGAPVAEILDLEEQIDLLCFVPERIKNKLREGQQVQIGTVEELGGGPRSQSEGASSAKASASSTGKIVFIADQAEVDSGNFAVKARFPNTRLKLPGYVTLRAQVLTTPGKAALTLPESAVMEDQDPPAVIVVEDEKVEKKGEKETQTGTARKLQLRVGIRDRILHLVEILGLDDPEKKWHGSLDTAKFVIEKGQGLKTGDPIRLEEEDEDEAPAADEKKKEEG
jgi:membrane fusion protein, multidrug efflux system